MKFHPSLALAAAAACAAGVAAADPAADAASVLKPIIVTASPLSQDPDSLASIVDSVDRNQILRSGGATLADALADVPGVSGTTFAAGASRPVIRGFDANRVRTLEDGIGSFDVSDVGPDHGVPLDPLSADRIEVVRGAATLRYGSQAIGGVVNAINNRVPMARSDDALSGELAGGFDSNGSGRNGTARFDGTAGPVGWHLDGFGRDIGNYDVPGGTQPNSFFRGDGVAGGGSYFFGDSRIGAGLVHYDAKYGIPSDVTYIDMQQTKGMLRSSFAIDTGAFKTLTVEGGFGDYQHRERDPDGTVESTFRDQEWDSRAEALFGAMGPLDSTALGVQVQRKSFSALGEGADYLLPTLTRSAALFAFTETKLSKALQLQVAGRVERVNIDGTPAGGSDTTRRFTPTSASIGLVYKPSDAVKWGLTASSAARAPGQTELFARGPHDGPGTYETGDSNLGLERANSLEGTLQVNHGGTRYEGSVWVSRFNGYVYGALTGRTCDDEGACAIGDSGELKELLYRQTSATFRGAEGRASFPLLEHASGMLKIRLLADYVRAELSEGGGNVPRMPPWHVATGLDWNSPSFEAGFTFRYSGAHTETAFAETPTGGFLNLDVNATWRPIASNRNVSLTVVGRNLTDSAQRNSVALNKDLVLLPGRDVRALFRVAF